ncbi:porphobilinogen synthase [Schleiferia thermophila]|jgi:porphobilinogen synthase|uniref:Delta-aminolevulinic acid dehydratase n=1 Tax=Schleiferia thermophila TaxID=884107 RepID=A0A369A407_9FLAO|nr:porphobilinogen synthase [Schleiferia thermophila]KFD39253.1 delta-aminolevulinic acid dehydratase [Schleiferia thermophila str. Yellowstone]RCX03138.1 porphobilinogen synthase [Schleiferia thermophila]
MHLHRRNRTLRKNESIRKMVEETTLRTEDFIVPMFIIEGHRKEEDIPSMPGYKRYTLDVAVEMAIKYRNLGLRSVLLFVKCKNELKDNTGAEALNPEGLMQRSIRAIKTAVPDLVVMTDVALDPYSTYGHDGIVADGEILNDPTVEVLAEMAVSHAEAGADFVAPSDMMDGRVGAIRRALEQSGHTRTGILAYSAKYASCFYGPFRDALDSAPGFGDKKTYQMNPANRIEAIKEVLDDVKEGADIVMVKPAVHYLDIIREVKNQVHVPVAAYHVSGEYSMIKAASEKGWLHYQSAVLEATLAIKRAGADLIASYFAPEIAGWLQER